MFEEQPARAPAGTDTTPSRLYWCAPCNTKVAREADLVDDNGIFTNPAGEVFRLGRFRQANVIVTSEPTLEATWFPGFAWSYAHCANCRAHLGWRYDGADDRFYGLILTRLVGPI